MSPRHQEGRVSAVDQLTESLTADTPSGNPRALLSLRQLLVFLVREHRRPLKELAELLDVSRKTIHVELRRAIRTLSEHGPTAIDPPSPSLGRPYQCPNHAGGCSDRCRYLRRWLRGFDRAMPATE